MENKISYSIITPVYNRADCIMRCLESVDRAIGLLNGMCNVEHIIVDDGSTDATCNIVEKFAKSHPYLTFVKFEHNRGTNAARNEAIRRAKGDWCIILDSDDYFVDSALQTIIRVMDEKNDYKHYMFAPDDMQSYYMENSIIQGANQKVLLYPDFLNGYIDGDFIHVCNTEILRKHPFDEQLRIYEGVFFLLFYRDAQQMLFTNQVVTIRERSRSDSVTRNVIRTNNEVIKRTILSQELMLKYFENDLVKMGMDSRLHFLKIALYENYLLLSEYSKIAQLNVKSFCSKKEQILHVVCSLHLGTWYRLMLKAYLIWKYEIMKKKLGS